MKIKAVTFEEFLQLDEATREFHETAYALQEPMEVDCKSWKFGTVKEMQIRLSKAITYNDIIEVVNNVKENALHLQAHIVFGLFIGVQKSIMEIADIENKTLSSQLTAKEIMAMEAVGGFERFGKLPEFISLANKWGISYEEVYNMPWDLAFSTLYLDKVTNDYQKQLYKND